jgi:hypothetical protein
LARARELYQQAIAASAYTDATRNLRDLEAQASGSPAARSGAAERKPTIQ